MAILIARARALKMASILWCSLVPWAFMLRLMRASSASVLKKCWNISVGMSPIFSLLNVASHMNHGRSPKSMATCASESSMGSVNP